MSESQTVENIQKIRAMYDALLKKYAEEAQQVENIDELYTKFRNLKLYEMQFDKHEELKKQLQFWNNPIYHQKSEREEELERELHHALEINGRIKMQLNAMAPGYEQHPAKR